MLLLIYVDLRVRPAVPRRQPRGVYDRIAWLFWQPTLYALAVPALGIIADVVPVFAQRRHQPHGAAMALHRRCSARWLRRLGPDRLQLDGGVDRPVALRRRRGSWWASWPSSRSLGLLGLWTATLRRGKVRVGTPLILALLGALRARSASPPARATAIEGLDLDGTTWMTGQARPGARRHRCSAGLAGLVFWAPKLYGRLLPDGRRPAGRHAAGPRRAGGGGDPRHRRRARPAPRAAGGSASSRRIRARPATSSTVEVLNLVAGIGLAVVVLGGLLVALRAAQRGRERAGRRRPVGGPHARVGDHVAAADRQLRQRAGDHVRGPAVRRPPRRRRGTDGGIRLMATTADRPRDLRRGPARPARPAPGAAGGQRPRRRAAAAIVVLSAGRHLRSACAPTSLGDGERVAARGHVTSSSTPGNMGMATLLAVAGHGGVGRATRCATTTASTPTWRSASRSCSASPTSTSSPTGGSRSGLGITQLDAGAADLHDHRRCTSP